MSKLAYEAASMIVSQLEDTIAGLTPDEPRVGTNNSDVNPLHQNPIDPIRVKWMLEALLPWAKALKEDLKS